MPSPLGHALASALLHRTKVSGKWLSDWKRLAFHLFCGICPDLDFIPGLLIGNINRFHHGFSHSFFGAFVIAVGLWAFYGFWRSTWKVSDGLFIFSLVALHPVMDVLAMDTAFPYGCPLLYPFVKASYISPYVFFEDIQRPSLKGFFFGHNNLLAFGIEFSFFTPLLLAATFAKKRKWIWILTGAISLSVLLFYLHKVYITSSGIEFIRVLSIKMCFLNR